MKRPRAFHGHKFEASHFPQTSVTKDHFNLHSFFLSTHMEHKSKRTSLLLTKGSQILTLGAPGGEEEGRMSLHAGQGADSTVANVGKAASPAGALGKQW